MQNIPSLDSKVLKNLNNSYLFGGLEILYFVNVFSWDDDHRQPEPQQEDEKNSKEIVDTEGLDTITKTALTNTGDKSVVSGD